MDVFSQRRPDPSPFSHRAIEPTYDVYGWRVSLDRPVVEFSSLENASRDGFTVTGSGGATVTTDRLFKPRSSYVVTVATCTVVAGDSWVGVNERHVDGEASRIAPSRGRR